MTSFPFALAHRRLTEQTLYTDSIIWYQKQHNEQLLQYNFSFFHLCGNVRVVPRTGSMGLSYPRSSQSALRWTSMMEVNTQLHQL
jgi:hypothetical protein